MKCVANYKEIFKYAKRLLFMESNGERIYKMKRRFSSMYNMKINLLNELLNQLGSSVEFRLIGIKGLNEQLFIVVEGENDTLVKGLTEKEEWGQLID